MRIHGRSAIARAARLTPRSAQICPGRGAERGSNSSETLTAHRPVDLPAHRYGTEVTLTLFGDSGATRSPNPVRGSTAPRGPSGRMMGWTEERKTKVKALDYIFTLPKAVPNGMVLVHNQVTRNITPSRRPGFEGFRVWLTGDPSRLKVCHCGWMPALGSTMRSPSMRSPSEAGLPANRKRLRLRRTPVSSRFNADA